MNHSILLQPILGNQKKRLTISDIARLAGVSKATASFVLSGRSKEYRVADETRDRVLAIAAEHHYQPSLHARSLKATRTGTLGLVVPEMTNYGFASISRELETLCRESGQQLLIACSDENPSQEMMAVNSLIQRQVDGLIVASSSVLDTEYQKISERTPVVLLDRRIEETRLPWVITDSVESTAEMVENLASLHPDEVYYMGGPLRLGPSRERLAGYELGLQRAGVEPKPGWVLHGQYSPSSAYERMATLCNELGRPPKALFTAACGLLEGVLRYMNQHQLMDADIHLCSFDDHYLFDCLPLRIDTIAQDNEALASRSYQMINRLINEQPLESATQLLPGQIHWRHPLSRQRKA